MLSRFPPPDENEKLDYSWGQLTLGVDSLNSYYKIIEDFWPIIVKTLDKVRNIDIQGPKEDAWFHLRRTSHCNKPPTSRYASKRIEILRVKKGFAPQQIQEKIRLLAQKYNDVICAGWWPLNLEEYDNAFLSFLQKLSALRGRDRIFYNGFLGQTPTNDYDKCPHCQEAYRVMMTPNSPWYEALNPWFIYMSSINMEKTHEYAHWFGHILSGWQ